MGFGTSFPCEIYLSREDYKNKYEVEDKIKDLKKWNESLKLDFYAMCACNDLRTLMEKDNECNTLQWLSTEFYEKLEWYEENLIKIYNLKLLLENFDKKEFG